MGVLRKTSSLTGDAEVRSYSAYNVFFLRYSASLYAASRESM